MLQKITDLIIKPYKPKYNPDVDLGPNNFSIGQEHVGFRHDFEVVNRRNQTLQCSMFHLETQKDKKYPLMIYCHGNTGNRTSSYGAVYSMLKSKINVLTFDFSGCGLSEGETISLGYYENHDIADVLDYALRKFSYIDANRIGIWGRCMGAVSAIMFTARSNCVSLLILDSPFPDFPSLLKYYFEKVKILPKWAEDYIYTNVRTKIKDQANFDIEDIDPINKIGGFRIPAFFVHGNQDAIIPIHLFKKVFEHYPGPKEYIELPTSHNDSRPDYVFEAIAKFVRSKFYTMNKYGKFEPSPKKMTSGKNPVKNIPTTLLNLDTIRFNDSEKGQNDPTPYGVILESFRSHEINDPSKMNDEQREIYQIRRSLQSQKYPNDKLLEESKRKNSDTKPDIRYYSTSTISKVLNWSQKKPEYMDSKRGDRLISLEEADECNISEELLDSDEAANRNYLEISPIHSASKITFQKVLSERIVLSKR